MSLSTQALANAFKGTTRRRGKMKPFTSLPTTVDVMNDETGTFTDPETGFVEKENQKEITPPNTHLRRVPGAKIDGIEKLTDLDEGINCSSKMTRSNMGTTTGFQAPRRIRRLLDAGTRGRRFVRLRGHGGYDRISAV